MSDDERLNLRDLPPVPPIGDWPDRYSQTLLRNADACLRAAYLYVKFRGGTPGHQLDRGSLAHAVFEAMTLDLVAAGQSSYIAPEFTQGRFGEVVPEDPALAARQIASFTAAIVDEVAEERTDLAVPAAEKDAVRVMAYHWALGMEIDPEKVVAVERKFILEIAGHEVSGKIDLAAIGGDVAQVDDYKTSFAVPDQEAYEKGFQARLYALLLLFGNPVEKLQCSQCLGVGVYQPRPVEHHDPGPCDECGGRGYIERLEEPIGDRIQWVRTRELYPRYLLDDGTLKLRQAVLSRTDVADFRNDVEGTIRRLDSARDSWKFPAVSGSHCVLCPCEPECPLPAHLRRWAGAINSMDQAAEALEWADRMASRVKATNEEVKRYAGAHGPVRYGGDMVAEFETREGRAVKKVGSRSDWDGLVAAVEEAATFGTPFEVAEWIRRTSSTTFRKRKLTVKERELEGEPAPMVERDFGDDPPF